MSSYKELLAQRSALEKQIEEARELEFAQVVSDIKQKMVDYGISLADLGISSTRGKAVKARSTVAPKYRDPESGATWSGRGKPPRWIVGKERDAFSVG